MINHIQRHVQGCSFCRREKLVADRWVKVDHLSQIPITEAIPNKEAATAADAIYKKLILGLYCQIMAKNLQMTCLHMSVMNLT